MQRKEWHILQPESEKVRRLAVRLDISETLASILANRGLAAPDEAQSFLNPSLGDLHDPFLMSGMDRAVDLLRDAVSAKAPILVFGDYDVDGVTASALLVSFLRQYTDSVSYYIPHRVEEGYGLQKERISRFAEEGGKVVLTVDCGISNIEEVIHGSALGLTFIITDHHEAPPELPPAHAILNPKQPGCPYPCKDLAGVGIAFKLAQGLSSTLAEAPGGRGGDVFSYLDLAALGTVADIVPLRDENRILVRYGLEVLRNPARQGLRDLKEVAGIWSRPLKTSHIAFALGPRINAAGRLGRANDAVELLLAVDPLRSRILADTLNDLNRSRQQIEADILREATDMIESSHALLDEPILILSDDNWHSGVIGIVASKLAERHLKPCLLISSDGEPGRGSARSGPNFDLYDSLQECRDLFEAFGGHAFAAGLSIRKENIPVLRQRLSGRSLPRSEPSRNTLNVDARLSFAQLRAPLLKELAMLMPFGYSNPSPVFISEGVHLASQPRLVGRNHLRLEILQKPHRMRAIGFQMGDMIEHFSGGFAFDIAYNLDIDPQNPGNLRDLRLADINLPYA
jgi:single-stranded-DNA-specific exonuclease